MKRVITLVDGSYKVGETFTAPNGGTYQVRIAPNPHLGDLHGIGIADLIESPNPKDLLCRLTSPTVQEKVGPGDFLGGHDD